MAKSESPLVSLIWNQAVAPTNIGVNAPLTLPSTLIPKSQLNDEIAAKNPGAAPITLKFKQFIGFGKQILKFYKNGIVNVWKNHKVITELQKRVYVVDIDSQGLEQRQVPTNFGKLTEEMLTVLYESKLQLKLLPAPELFAISRSDYQTIRRTKQDFYKLPMFAILFVIFEESMPVLCYLLPEVTPSTCVLPNLLPKIWGFPKYTNELRQLKADRYPTAEDKVTGAMQTAYLMPLDEAQRLCRVLRLTPRLIPTNWYPETSIRNRLQAYYNYLVVDNYYLSGLNGNGLVFDLMPQELAEACLERQLIDDIGKFKEISDIADPEKRQAAHDELQGELQTKLAKFIVDFETFNMGLIGMDTK